MAKKKTQKKTLKECPSERILRKDFPDYEEMADAGCIAFDCPKHGYDATLKQAKAINPDLGGMLEELFKGPR